MNLVPVYVHIGSDEQNSRVVGGHACLWGELVDSSNFLPRMW